MGGEEFSKSPLFKGDLGRDRYRLSVSIMTFQTSSYANCCFFHSRSVNEI